MPNKHIFCNTPWYEIHIYQDGRLGICCQEAEPLYDSSQTQYNIASMSLMDWFNSEPATTFRKQLLGNDRSRFCTKCYQEESLEGNSRRLKSNMKSVIFTRTAFDDSWQQSPGRQHFDYSAQHNGFTDTVPIDLHVDLGNYCNMACKMCRSVNSSTIAGQEVKWGITDSKKYLGVDWTRDQQVWNSFKQQILALPGLNNIHFMGGETLLTNRIEDLVDCLIQHNRYDVCISFVTNGSKFNASLMKKLSKFRRVGIEVSIENIGARNDYIRQGFPTVEILNNIALFQQYCNNNSITLTLRPAISLLSIGEYVDVLEYALQHQLVIKSSLVLRPKFLDVRVLPNTVKKQYAVKFQKFIEQFSNDPVAQDYNASDPNNVRLIIKEQAQQCLAALAAPAPSDAEQLLEQMVQHCQKWDQVYNNNARALYPELDEVWDRYGY
jgi:hypothetical protein